MRALCFATAFAAWLYLMPFANRAAFGEKDYLFEVYLKEFPKIRSILQKKLGPTSFDCGRIMAEPAFAPEYSVSVYSSLLKDGRRKYFVTYIETDRNLWQATDIGRHPKEAETVKIRRTDCEIDAATANLLRQGWIQMLSGTQRPRPMQQEDAERSTDTTIVEFSVQANPSETLYGKLNFDLPAPGKKTGALLDLANMLIGYCKAEPKDRSAIAANIERKATRLLEMLKQK